MGKSAKKPIKVSNRKKYGPGGVLHDLGLGIADTALGAVGMGNVIEDNQYNTQNGAKIANATGAVGKMVLPMALGAVGVPPMATKMAQGVAGTLNPEQQSQYINPMQMQAMGDKMSYGPGGPVRPAITTNDPNDPRIKAYNDSLNVYNYNQGWNKIIDTYKTEPGKAGKVVNGLDWYKAAQNQSTSSLGKKAEAVIKKNPNIITPTKEQPYLGTMNGAGVYAAPATATQPVQPYVYQPAPTPPAETQPVSTPTTPVQAPANTGTWTDYYGQVHKGVQPKPAQYQAPVNHAMGGNLTRYNNGGTHESNPNGGIPLGVDSLVEEGETRMGDYIFSDRLKYKGKKTYADYSKKIEDSYKDTKDKLRLEAKDKHLKNLENHQEQVRSKLDIKNQRKFAPGGPLTQEQWQSQINPYYTLDPNSIYAPQPTDFMGSIGNQTPSGVPQGVQRDSEFGPGQQAIPVRQSNLSQPQMQIPGVQQNPAELSPSNSYENSGMQGNKINPWIAGAQMLGPLSELAYGLKGGDPVNFERAQANLLNPASAKTVAGNAITQSYNAGNAAMRNNNLPSVIFPY